MNFIQILQWFELVSASPKYLRLALIANWKLKSRSHAGETLRNLSPNFENFTHERLWPKQFYGKMAKVFNKLYLAEWKSYDCEILTTSDCDDCCQSSTHLSLQIINFCSCNGENGVKVIELKASQVLVFILVNLLSSIYFESSNHSIWDLSMNRRCLNYALYLFIFENKNDLKTM